MADVEVVDSPQRSRFELMVGGALAGTVTYRLDEGSIVLLHTEIEPDFEGQGLGAKLAAGALGAVKERGLSAVPKCAFIISYLRRHPELA